MKTIVTFILGALLLISTCIHAAAAVTPQYFEVNVINNIYDDIIKIKGDKYAPKKVEDGEDSRAYRYELNINRSTPAKTMMKTVAYRMQHYKKAVCLFTYGLDKQHNCVAKGERSQKVKPSKNTPIVSCKHVKAQRKGNRCVFHLTFGMPTQDEIKPNASE